MGVDQKFLDAAELMARGHLTYEYDTGNGNFKYFFPWYKPVTEIGFVLGFAGASTFWRAFRRWDRQVAARVRATLERSASFDVDTRQDRQP